MIRRNFIAVVAAAVFAPIKAITKPEPEITKILMKTNYELKRVFGCPLEDFEKPAPLERFVDVYYGEKIRKFEIGHTEWTQLPTPPKTKGNRHHHYAIEKTVLTDDTLQLFLVGGGLGIFSGLKEIV